MRHTLQNYWLNCRTIAAHDKKKKFYSSYENIINELCNCGAFVEQKNDSKEFLRLYLTHVYSAIAKNISSYIINEAGVIVFRGS